MEPRLGGCPLAGIPGFFCMNGLFLVGYFGLWGPGHRRLLRGSWTASVRVPVAPSGRKLAGLVRGGCLPADHTVQTRAAAAHCGWKHQHGLQSKRTLIWTNRAVAGAWGGQSVRGCWCGVPTSWVGTGLPPSLSSPGKGDSMARAEKEINLEGGHLSDSPRMLPSGGKTMWKGTGSDQVTV